MRVLIADSFEQSGIDGLKVAACDVVYMSTDVPTDDRGQRDRKSVV